MRPNHSFVDNSAEMEHWKTQLNLDENKPEEDDTEGLWRKCFKATESNCVHQYSEVILYASAIVVRYIM